MSQFFPSGGESIGASASVLPKNEYLGLISFRIDWFDFLAVQGTLKSLLQHQFFALSQLFTSDNQSTGDSASVSVFSKNTQGWFPLGRTGLISLMSKELFKSLLQHHSLKASVLWPSAFFMIQLSHPYMTTGKNVALTRWTFVGKVMSLLCNMLPRFAIAFLPRSKCPFIPRL